MARENLNSFSKISLQEVIDSNLKIVTFYRIALAFMVFASHSYPIFLGKPDPQVPFYWRSSVSFGTFAVGGFFALSGLLLYSSAKNLPPRVWIIRRSLRLLPAYAACLIFCSFLLGPLAIFMETRDLSKFFNFSPIGPFFYTWNNLFLPIGITYALNNSFSNTPYGILTGGASVVNGSIWSLPYEVRCYLIFAIVFYFSSAKFRDKFIVFLTIVTFTGYLLHGNLQFQRLAAPLWKFSDPLLLQLLSIFLMGACFGIYAKKISINYRTLILVIFIYLISSFHFKFISTVGIALTVIIPFILGKYTLLKTSNRNFPVSDISYGLYLYSFPIQQLTVSLFPKTSFVALFLAAFFASLCLSFLSFKLIEKPTIKFGRSFNS
jgi:peptidoglycan/LPS O-acetylase OafA/YrhL